MSNVVPCGGGVYGAGMNPETLIEAFGTIGLFAIVFAESGLLVGFFLPGDSLLFTAGLLASKGTLNLPLIMVGCSIAAIAGDQVGYVIGSRAGPKIFHRPDSRFFRKEFVDKAYSYFERYGGRTIVVARFVPIVRTFVPVIAGVSQMSYRTFVAYNVLGGVLWGVSVTTIGYYLGQIDFVADNIEPILIGIVALSVLPIAFELLRARSRSRSTD